MGTPHIKTPEWTISTALQLVREIQGDLLPLGFHVALAGGVLNRGVSFKDLDLVFLPLTNDKAPDATALATHLLGIFGSPDLSENNGHSHSPNPYSPYRQQFTIPASDKFKRIDLFIV